jgi:glycine hydroxymethyltransferase
LTRRHLNKLNKIVENHHRWRLQECLNLIPSENRESDRLRSMFMTDLGGRYTAPDRFYRGTKYTDELVAFTEDLACLAFKAKFADISPLSGHHANMAVLLSMTGRRDKVISVSPDDGGYPGITQLGLGKLLGLENIYYPFDERRFNISTDDAIDLITKKGPRLLFFGSSFIPFPHPVREITKAFSAPSVYDGSHVMGLIAGGEFQDPLREGCSLLIGSTHKSLPGPQGGIILSNDEEIFSRVHNAMFPGVVDNIHLDRIAALAVSLIEMLEFGKNYARAVVRNSRALARALAERGVTLKGQADGYTKSHQVLLGYGTPALKSLATRLEKANIITDEGGRLGTSELTRMGYGPDDMETVAELLSAIILRNKTTDSVKKDVKSFVRRFQKPMFVLSSVPRKFA